MPWAKAGIIIKESTQPGSAYAAMMVTADHGVRMQDNYTNDTAGQPGAVSPASPRWLRLTRSGDTITGYDSADGTHWTQVGTVHLAGLPSTVQAGLFAASPAYQAISENFGGGENGIVAPSQDTAVFDHLSRSGAWPGGAWTGDYIGRRRRVRDRRVSPGRRPVRRDRVRRHRAGRDRAGRGRRHHYH